MKHSLSTINFFNSYFELLKHEDIAHVILHTYDQYPEKESFFLENAFFNLLAGNTFLMEQIITSTSLEQIKLSWEPRLTEFKNMRSKYILYEDFE